MNEFEWWALAVGGLVLLAGGGGCPLMTSGAGDASWLAPRDGASGTVVDAAPDRADEGPAVAPDGGDSGQAIPFDAETGVDEAPSPPASCKDLLLRNPSSNNGQYLIEVNGESRHVFCDMSQGGWTRVILIDGHNCPTAWEAEEAFAETSVCRLPEPGVGGAIGAVRLPSPLESYSQVRGYVQGYQYASPDGFLDPSEGLDDNYVDGLSLTYGQQPRHHLWTFAVGINLQHGQSSCPCAQGRLPPSWVAGHYSCDTGHHGAGWEGQWYDEPLWDNGTVGDQCGAPEQPNWFSRDLEGHTSEPLEARIMVDQHDENIGISRLELFVR